MGRKVKMLVLKYILMSSNTTKVNQHYLTHKAEVIVYITNVSSTLVDSLLYKER